MEQRQSTLKCVNMKCEEQQSRRCRWKWEKTSKRNERTTTTTAAKTNARGSSTFCAYNRTARCVSLNAKYAPLKRYSTLYIYIHISQPAMRFCFECTAHSMRECRLKMKDLCFIVFYVWIFKWSFCVCISWCNCYDSTRIRWVFARKLVPLTPFALSIYLYPQYVLRMPELVRN